MPHWWRQRTLRFRLALWYAVGGAVLIAGFSAVLYYYISERMAQPLDAQLRRDVDAIVARLEILPSGQIRWAGRVLGQAGARPTDYPWFELWDEQDRLVARVWPFTETQVQNLPTAPVRGRDTISVFSVADAIRVRVLSIPYRPPGSATSWMLRAIRIHEPVAGALAVVRWIILIALPLIVSLLVFGGYFISRRWLSQLNRVVSQADRITADNLAVRLPVENPHDEVGRLTGVFNVTLDRLESSFAALDHFVADASHELRTPLTTLRSVGEIGLRRERTPEEYREIIGSMLEEAQRLDALIGRLLELAAVEGGSPQLKRTPVRLDEFVRECIGELAILAESKGQQVRIEAAPCAVTTDPVLLRRALQNLVENAIKFSPASSTVQVLVRCEPARAVVSVIDEGPGIAAADRERLTERFFRADRARARGTGGFGLGLSITKAYLRVLGGTLEQENVAPQGSAFRLVLPL